MIPTRDATHISVIVKGDRLEALRSAASQGIPATFVRSTPHGESVLLVEMTERRKVIQWYNRGGTGNLPLGTPLLFTETYVPPYKTGDVR